MQKAAKTASIFIRELSLPRRAQVAVLHTRLATQGHEKWPENNHPIRTGGIVGVHNGQCSNDYDLFDDLGIKDRRIGQVDSEAIFATLAYGWEPDGKGDTRLAGAGNSFTSALEVVEGSAAVAFLDEQDAEQNTLHLARCRYSPLVVAQTEAGSLLFASTKEALELTALKCNLVIAEFIELNEGEYMKVVNGDIVEWSIFEPVPYYIPKRWGNKPQRSFGYTKWSSWDDEEYDLHWDRKERERLEQEERNAVAHVREVARRWEEDKQDDERDWVRVPQEDGTYIKVYIDNPEPTGQTPDYMAGAVGPVSTEGYLLTAKHLELGNTVPLVTGERHREKFARREEQAERWIEGLNCDNGTADHLANQLHLFLRVGDWVLTRVAGVDCYAQVYKMPDCFPGGVYVLRAVVPYSDDDGPRTEVVFVARQGSAFESVNEVTALALKTGGEAVA